MSQLIWGGAWGWTFLELPRWLLRIWTSQDFSSLYQYLSSPTMWKLCQYFPGSSAMQANSCGERALASSFIHSFSKCNLLHCTPLTRCWGDKCGPKLLPSRMPGLMIEMDTGEKTEERAGRNQRRLHRGGDIFFRVLKNVQELAKGKKRALCRYRLSIHCCVTNYAKI